MKIRKTPPAALLLLLLGGCASMQPDVTAIDHEWYMVAGFDQTVAGGDKTTTAVYELPEGARFGFGCIGTDMPMAGFLIDGVDLVPEQKRQVYVTIQKSPGSKDVSFQQMWIDHPNGVIIWGKDATDILTNLGMAESLTVTTEDLTYTFRPNFAGAVRAMAAKCPGVWNRT